MKDFELLEKFNKLNKEQKEYFIERLALIVKENQKVKPAIAK